MYCHLVRKNLHFVKQYHILTSSRCYNKKDYGSQNLSLLIVLHYNCVFHILQEVNAKLKVFI